MTTPTSIPVFADSLDVAIGAILLLAGAIVMIVRERTARYDVNVKGGVPYCPRCNRQVSYRRDVCRACGYRFKTYGVGPARAPAPRRGEGFAERIDALTEKVERWGLRRAERRAERRIAREAYYREHDVEPGPWAWYRVLPEWKQAVLLGLAIAAPAVVAVALLMR